MYTDILQNDIARCCTCSPIWNFRTVSKHNIEVYTNLLQKILQDVVHVHLCEISEQFLQTICIGYILSPSSATTSTRTTSASTGPHNVIHIPIWVAGGFSGPFSCNNRRFRFDGLPFRALCCCRCSLIARIWPCLFFAWRDADWSKGTCHDHTW